MILACSQFHPQLGDVDANLEFMVSACPDNVDVVVFPELATTGYLFKDASELERLAEPADGRSFSRLSELAAEKRCRIVYGFAEKYRGKFYNSAAIVSGSGMELLYRKVHLFDGERELFEAGTEGWPIIEIQGARVGVMICFDWIFPEAARSLAVSGADIICHPSNLVLPYCQEAMITRCLENRIYAATCNRIGADRVGDLELVFTGMSQIVSPRGERLAQAGGNTEECISVQIDPSLARDKSVRERSDLFAQRVPRLYSVISSDTFNPMVGTMSDTDVAQTDTESSDSRPYRKNVAMIVTDAKGLILAGERANMPGIWQLPQGGVEEGEKAIDAMKRELAEEIGTRRFELLAESKQWLTYDFPAWLADAAIAKAYRGQRQKYFVLRLEEGAGPDPSKADGEFISFRWMSPEELIDQVVAFKREVYRKAFDEMKSFIGP